MFKHKTGMRYVVGDHHKKICNALDRVVKGEIKRLIINIAPRYGKTQLVSKEFIAYGLALNPRSKLEVECMLSVLPARLLASVQAK